jgi:molecular chaperone Hsp33
MNGATAIDLAKTYLTGWELQELDHPYPVHYQCRCSIDRVKQVVACLTLAEIETLIEQDHGADMTCEFCGKKYRLEVADLNEIRQQVVRHSMH